MPIEGEVYTVDWIRKNGRDNVTGKIGPALALKEVPGTLPGIKSVGLARTRRDAVLGAWSEEQRARSWERGVKSPCQPMAGHDTVR